MIAETEPAALMGQQGGHGGGRIESEDRSAGQHDGMSLLDQVFGFKRTGFPPARRAAADVRGHGEHPVRHKHCHARQAGGIAGIADADPGNIGDEIARPWHFD